MIRSPHPTLSPSADIRHTHVLKLLGLVVNAENSRLSRALSIFTKQEVKSSIYITSTVACSQISRRMVELWSVPELTDMSVYILTLTTYSPYTLYRTLRFSSHSWNA